MQASPVNETTFQERPKHRPLIPVLVGFAGGIALDEAAEPLLLVWLILGCAALALALWGTLKGLKPWARWILAALILVPIGGAYHCQRFRTRPPRHLSDLVSEDGQRCYVRGRIAEEPELHLAAPAFGSKADERPQYSLSRVDVEALSADGRNWFRCEGGLAVFAEPEPPDLLPGDEVEFIATVRRYRSPANPGETDFRAIYERQGWHATASLVAGSDFSL